MFSIKISSFPLVYQYRSLKQRRHEFGDADNIKYKPIIFLRFFHTRIGTAKKI